MTRVHILSKKTIYIKLKIFLCVFHPIHEYFELSYEPVTLVRLLMSRKTRLQNISREDFEAHIELEDDVEIDLEAEFFLENNNEEADLDQDYDIDEIKENHSTSESSRALDAVILR